MKKNQPAAAQVRGQRRTLASKGDDVVIPAPGLTSEMPVSYGDWLGKLKERIQQDRLQAILSANSAMVIMYWDIGSAILEKQRTEGWGAKVIDRLAHDLKTAFPDMNGFSPRNLKYMRKFAESWPDRQIVQRTVAQIPWRSNLALLDKLDDPDARLWYANRERPSTIFL